MYRCEQNLQNNPPVRRCGYHDKYNEHQATTLQLYYAEKTSRRLQGNPDAIKSISTAHYPTIGDGLTPNLHRALEFELDRRGINRDVINGERKWHDIPWLNWSIFPRLKIIYSEHATQMDFGRDHQLREWGNYHYKIISCDVLRMLTDYDTGFQFKNINGFHMPLCHWTEAETLDVLYDGHAVGYKHPYVAISKEDSPRRLFRELNDVSIYRNYIDDQGYISVQLPLQFKSDTYITTREAAEKCDYELISCHDEPTPYLVNINNSQFSMFKIIPYRQRADRNTYKSFDEVNIAYWDYWNNMFILPDDKFETLMQFGKDQEYDEDKPIRNLNFVDFDVWEAITTPPPREEERETDDDDDEDDDGEEYESDDQSKKY